MCSSLWLYLTFMLIFRKKIIVDVMLIWHASPISMMKLNLDTSLSIEVRVGLDVIARESNGEVKFDTTQRIRAHWTVEVTEAKGIELAIRMGRRYRLQNVVVESDCLTVSSFRNLISYSIVFLLLVWIFLLLYGLMLKRDRNVVAHNLVKLILFGIEQVWVNHSPKEVTPHILMYNYLCSNTSLLLP